ncbi:hypothetical protein LXA43DRAFT_1013100 [Ganoderma leucocontextum]|nr:hypothetical protein LXA43DRAFT_1013100 [Ganoderma leucocontextum]
MNSTQSIRGEGEVSIRNPSSRASSKSPSPGPDRGNKNTVPGTIHYDVQVCAYFVHGSFCNTLNHAYYSDVASSRTTRLSRLTASMPWAGIGEHARDVTRPTPSAPPQMQLLSRHIGSYGLDVSLFGTILRTYISWYAVEWTPGGENRRAAAGGRARTRERTRETDARRQRRGQRWTRRRRCRRISRS